MTQLSLHFTLEEMLVSDTAARCGIDNLHPPPAAVAELTRLAAVLEKVRVLLGNVPILITSAYRCEKLNDEIKSKRTSQHITGQACDFIAPGFGTPKQICNVLLGHTYDLGIDQLIYEFDSWVHLSIAAEGAAPRQMAMTIDSRGTQTGIV